MISNGFKCAIVNMIHAFNSRYLRCVTNELLQSNPLKAENFRFKFFLQIFDVLHRGNRGAHLKFVLIGAFHVYIIFMECIAAHKVSCNSFRL